MIVPKGCKGCFRAGKVYCSECVLRRAFERKHGLPRYGSLANVRMGVDPMPKPR